MHALKIPLTYECAISKHYMDTNLRVHNNKGMIRLTNSRIGNFRIYCSLKLYSNYKSLIEAFSCN